MSTLMFVGLSKSKNDNYTDIVIYRYCELFWPQ